MIQKIQRVWLFCFVTLAVFSAFTYYFQDVFSDNVFEITSTAASSGRLSYAFFSILAANNYFIGPWIILLAPLYAAFYWFILRHRQKKQDIALPILLLVLVSLVCNQVMKALVGRGLQHFINETSPIAGNTLLLILLLTVVIAVLWLPTSYHQLYSKFKQRLMTLIQRRQQMITQDTSASVVVDEMPMEDQQHEDQQNADEQVAGIARVELGTQKFPEQVPLTFEAPVSGTVEVIAPKKSTTETITKKMKKNATLDYFSLVSNKMRGASSQRNTPEKQYFDLIITRIEEKLSEFRIDGNIINIMKGPVVDTFELELGSGVKVSKITSITEDISLALFGAPIRIVYPMKGKSTVGIEVPRNPREIIYLGEVLDSEAWKKNTFSLPLAMGKDAFGEPFVVDLATMPHMLVAGATGAGKSVFINSLLMSLLVKRSPEQMKLILIDPKQLELALYAKLPHLILPVLTDAKSASVALLYAVQEMERRYSILKEFAVRNIEGFNRKIKTATKEQIDSVRQHYGAEVDSYELPYLVIIVDEFADLILTKSGKDIENNICRLAAKARASGIHLVIATQRPSVDVITGLIKSNFPTRVSFRVTTSVDSRTILNAIGAERLLGKGDMLYKHGVEMIRVHSSFVEEDEIEAFTAELCAYENHYDEAALEFLENNQTGGLASGSLSGDLASGEGGELGDDEFYDQAVRIVAECRSASASMLQRRLKVGYNRAANLIDIMEHRGVVGPAQGSKPRKVLVAASDNTAE